MAENLSWHEKISKVSREHRHANRKRPFEGVAAMAIAEHYGEPGKINTIQKTLSHGKDRGIFAQPSRGAWDFRDEIDRDS